VGFFEGREAVLALFLFSVIVISLSGVMMPGPVFAMTVARSYKSSLAGPLVALGHGVIEIPLMLLIYFGFASFFKLGAVQVIIGVAGGFILIWMGLSMIRNRATQLTESEDPPYSSLVGGVITSTANPYFFLWWATIGSALIMRSIAFGIIGFVLLMIVHWSCDLIWYSLVSLTVHRTNHLWGSRLHEIIFIVCGLLLLGFGIWFIGSVLI